jgi:hypothetical protein
MHCCYYRPSATATPNSLMVVSSFVQTRELLSSLLLERWCRNNSCPCVSKFSTLKQIVQPAHPIVTEQRDRTPLPAALVCRAQAAVHFLIRISPDLPQLKCPLCLFSTSGRVIALVSWIRRDKGTTPMKKVSLGMAAVLALLSIAGCAQYVGKGKAAPPAAPVVTKG